MPSIFLCYRSGDDAYAAALIDERLSLEFGPESVFRASRSILPGEAYSEAIFRALENCKTVLVIIGPTWIDKLRWATANAADDWVRIEIAKALNSSALVIPVLLSRVPRLERQSIPPDIAELAEKQYLKFEHRNVTGDAEQLIAALKRTNKCIDADQPNETGKCTPGLCRPEPNKRVRFPLRLPWKISLGRR